MQSQRSGKFIFAFIVATKIWGSFERYFFLVVGQICNLSFTDGFFHVTKYYFQQRNIRLPSICRNLCQRKVDNLLCNKTIVATFSNWPSPEVSQNILLIAHTPAIVLDPINMAVVFFSQLLLRKSYHTFCLYIFSSHKP